MMGALPAEVLARLRCADCGERLVRGRTAGSLIHKARLVASCDLDSDHPPRPDWAALGTPACRRCGEPTAAGPEGFRHVAPARDDDHPAEPGTA
jgi:hypothetical protein